MRIICLLLLSSGVCRADLLFSCGNVMPQLFVNLNTEMRVFVEQTYPSGATLPAEILVVPGGTSIQVDLSAYYQTNASVSMDFQFWIFSNAAPYEPVMLNDSGWQNVVDGMSVGFDSGPYPPVYEYAQDGSFGYNTPNFFMAYDVVRNHADESWRCLNASAIGLTAGCGFLALIAGFSAVRSTVTEKEDI